MNVVRLINSILCNVIININTWYTYVAISFQGRSGTAFLCRGVNDIALWTTRIGHYLAYTLQLTNAETFDRCQIYMQHATRAPIKEVNWASHSEEVARAQRGMADTCVRACRRV